MSTPNPREIWQVEVGGQVYEAAFAELSDWIGEGSLQPEDKVRKGNLRWIEARRVPSLVPFFNAKEKGLPMPVVVSTTDAADPVTVEAPSPAIDAEPLSPASISSMPDPIEHSIAVPAEPQVATHHDPRSARTAEAGVLYHANQLDAVAATRPTDT